jgi:predicted transcriptional regulator
MPKMEKQKVQAVLDSFSGDVDVDAFLEKIAVLDDIERGERQIAAGETVPHDVVRERIERICR